MKKSRLRDYSKPVKTRSGCKVSWAYYATEAEAKECGIAARFNAQILEAQGYDFGYQSPGSISKTSDGLYEVCLP